MNKLMTAELHSKGSAGLSALMTPETTNYQLYDLARRLGIKLEAICYVDQLKYVKCPTVDRANYGHSPKEKSVANYIINLKQPTHWVALFICKYKHKKIGFYFNSYAAIMPVPDDVVKFMRRCKCNMYYDSDKSVQTSSQGHCGHFAMSFLLHMNKSGDPINNYERFLSHLHNTDMENVSYVIRQLIN